MFGYSTLALMALALSASAALSQSVNCGSYSNAGACNAQPLCQWFLNQCIDRPQVDCTNIKNRATCKNTPGCLYYPQPRWWLPTTFIENNFIDPKAPVIGCDTNTMCSRLTVSYWCNSYSHCAWVDGECQTYGTPSNPNWEPDCTRVLARRRQNCVDLFPKCKYVNMRVCKNNGSNCQNVLYGCRSRNWCDVGGKGINVREQCRLLGDNCMWENNKCVAAPTAAPTSGAPSKSPTTSAPTKSPSRSPTKRPTTGAPSKTPTTSPPTKAPTTRSPTPPTTLAPTLRPTTGSPTRPFCPLTSGAGTLQCRSQPFAQVETVVTPPPTVADKKRYCADVCSDNGAQGGFGVPEFPGCRAFTFDGTTCRFFGCSVGVTGPLAATVVAQANTEWSVLAAACYNGGQFPTPAPTVSCVYSNADNPPRAVADKRPIAESCQVGTITIPREFTGSARVRLDWCQYACTNFYPGCTVTESYDAPPNNPTNFIGRCVYARCSTTQAQTLDRPIYRAVKSDVCG